MAFTQEQYDTVLEAINNTDLPTNLKADMVQIMDKGNPVQPHDFRQEFLDLPTGTVVQITNVRGSTRIAVRNPSWAEEAPMSLFYSGTPDDMRGRVIDGGHIGDLLWDDVVGMTVLAPKEPEPDVPEAYFMKDNRDVNWIVMHSVEQIKKWNAQDTADLYADVVAPYRGEAPERDDWEYVTAKDIIDGDRNVSFPVYGRPDGDDCAFGQDIIDTVKQ